MSIEQFNLSMRPVDRSCDVCSHPGGKWTTTAKIPGELSTGAMGTVSTHLVKEPQRWTCHASIIRKLGGRQLKLLRLTARPPKRQTKRVGTKKEAPPKAACMQSFVQYKEVERSYFRSLF